MLWKKGSRGDGRRKNTLGKLWITRSEQHFCKQGRVLKVGRGDVDGRSVLRKGKMRPEVLGQECDKRERCRVSLQHLGFSEDLDTQRGDLKMLISSTSRQICQAFNEKEE